MKVQIFDLDIPQKNNIQVIQLLSRHHWFRGFETDNPDFLEELEQGINSGLTVMTYNSDTNDLINLDTPLNVFANLIWQITMKKLNFDGKLHRFFWNFYTPGNTTNLHKDMQNSGFYSIIYNLHTTDGGTEIDNIIYPDKESQVKIFNSDTPHKGIAPKKTNFRMNLNIVFSKS